MGFKCGIVGLPNVGKSTLFNALTCSNSVAGNYPFCTVEPNVGMVSVPDARLGQLAELVSPARIVPARMQFVDIAGLVRNASQGEGLGNQFLAHVRETQAIAHVVRCFEDKDIAHVSGRVEPLDDIDVINTELCLADQDCVERALQKTLKHRKSGDQEVAAAKCSVLERVLAHLDQGQPARSAALDAEERAALAGLQLITAKPVLYIANVEEGGEDPKSNPRLAPLAALADQENTHLVPVCASLEAEIAQLDEADRQAFLTESGRAQPGLERVIRAGYALLGLCTYFTAGEKELRAWTIRQGDTAPQAAGVIHGDFERGFIRAEVVPFDDYIACRGEQGAKAAGLWRSEGRDYIVCDGDVILFRTNV